MLMIIHFSFSLHLSKISDQWERTSWWPWHLFASLDHLGLYNDDKWPKRKMEQLLTVILAPESEQNKQARGLSTPKTILKPMFQLLTN